MPYKSLWLFKKGFIQTQNPILLLETISLSQLILGIYIGNGVITCNLH